MAQTQSKPRGVHSPKADMAFGVSDSKKTSQIGRLARYVYKKHHQKTRLVTADPGGWEPIENYVKLGIIQPLSMLDSRISHPGDVIVKLTQGYWPFLADGTPIVKTVDGRDIFDFTDKRAMPTNETWEEIGGYGIEGLQSISMQIQQRLSQGDALTEMAGGAGSKSQQTSQIREGTEKWVQPGQGFYNFIIGKMYRLVANSCQLPVKKCLWTSLIKLYEKKDKEGNVITSGPYGPSMVGNEGVVLTPQWFGDLIHLDIVETGVDKEDRPDKAKRVAADVVGFKTTEIRAYCRSHVNPKDGHSVPCKLRVVAEMVHKLQPSFVVTPDKGIDYIYEMEDALEAEGVDALAADLGMTR